MDKRKKLLKDYLELKSKQERLKKAVKDTHIEIEWLNKEMDIFKKSGFFKFIKSLKS